jgi:hypothetical protein
MDHLDLKFKGYRPQQDLHESGGHWTPVGAPVFHQCKNNGSITWSSITCQKICLRRQKKFQETLSKKSSRAPISLSRHWSHASKYEDNANYLQKCNKRHCDSCYFRLTTVNFCFRLSKIVRKFCLLSGRILSKFYHLQICNGKILSRVLTTVEQGWD